MTKNYSYCRIISKTLRTNLKNRSQLFNFVSDFSFITVIMYEILFILDCIFYLTLKTIFYNFVIPISVL